MFKNNDVIKNKWSTKNIFLPKSSEIDSRRIHKIFQKGLMKNKKTASQKIGVFYWTLPLPELSRFKKGNGFFSSICWLAGLCL